MSPRAYRMTLRQTSTEKNRDRILAAASAVLLREDFSEFSMEAVARQARVSRLTIYYQFESKAGLLEALYNQIAKRGEIERLADVFRNGGDPLRTLRDFTEVFARFWNSDRDLIRRLHALAGIDADIGKGVRARNERRRNGARVIVKRYCRMYPALTPAEESVAIDTLHMLTSFETFDALSADGRGLREVIEIIEQLARKVIRLTSRVVPSG